MKSASPCRAMPSSRWTATAQVEDAGWIVAKVLRDITGAKEIGRPDAGRADLAAAAIPARAPLSYADARRQRRHDPGLSIKASDDAARHNVTAIVGADAPTSIQFFIAARRVRGNAVMNSGIGLSGRMAYRQPASASDGTKINGWRNLDDHTAPAAKVEFQKDQPKIGFGD